MALKVAVPALGTTLALGRPAGRIVSLVSSATETLFAPGAGDAVAGVTPGGPATCRGSPLVASLSPRRTGGEGQGEGAALRPRVRT